MAVALLLNLIGCIVTSPAELPVPVTAAVAVWADRCRAANGTPRTDNGVKRSDLNGDSREDYVFFLGWLACDNAAGMVGDREKALVVFVSDGAGGVRPAFYEQAFDARIVERGTTRILWLTKSARECGRLPAQSFSEETFCDRAVVWNPNGQFELSPVDTARIIE